MASRHHVVHAFRDVHRVVTDPFVEPSHHCELHRGLKIQPSRGVRLEDGLDQVVVKLVEDVVHVVQGCRERGITLDVGIEGPAEQLLGLRAHPGDQAADLRIEAVPPVEAARGLADVDHQVARPLDLADELDRGR